MLTLTPYLEWPAVGTVIKCENGHDAVRVTGEAANAEFNGTHDPSYWPEAERMDGSNIVGEMLPVCCKACGARVIDWDHRFVGIPLDALTRERVAEVIAE